ncbi:MAG: funZ protein, partial [Anaerolineae bacterium]|nr:funZ protein [Anaerolineae bacterium]
NSVVLNWITTFEEYRSSEIFEMTDRLFSFQQTEELELGQAWDYYFPFKIRNFRTGRYDDSPFIELLKISLYRPRDFISLLDLLKKQVVENNGTEGINRKVFIEKDIFQSTFRRDYAQYLLGEVKDQLVFYHTLDDYKVFRDFFTYLDGRIQFSYDDYVLAYEKMLNSLEKRSDPNPTFFETPDIFLQFLYELNVLCYYQDTERGNRHYHWCFRDRTPTNLSPRVKTNVDYLIQFGIAKALDIGETFRQ